MGRLTNIPKGLPLIAHGLPRSGCPGKGLQQPVATGHGFDGPGNEADGDS